MTTINIQEEIQKAMLDDEFVRVFASKFRAVMIDMENQAQQQPSEDPETVDFEDCDISLNMAQDDPLAFEVHVENFLSKEPTVFVKNRNDGIVLTLAPHLNEQVLAILKESGFDQNSGVFLGGLIVKEEKANG